MLSQIIFQDTKNCARQSNKNLKSIPQELSITQFAKYVHLIQVVHVQINEHNHA